MKKKHLSKKETHFDKETLCEKETHFEKETHEKETYFHSDKETSFEKKLILKKFYPNNKASAGLVSSPAERLTTVSCPLHVQQHTVFNKLFQKNPK